MRWRFFVAIHGWTSLANSPLQGAYGVVTTGFSHKRLPRTEEPLDERSQSIIIPDHVALMVNNIEILFFTFVVVSSDDSSIHKVDFDNRWSSQITIVITCSYGIDNPLCFM